MENNSDNFTISEKNTKTILNESTRLVLKYWYTKCKVYYKCHKESSIYYDKLNRFMGIPSILVGIFNTTTIFSNLSSTNETLLITNGVASCISTLLVAMQNYYDFGKLATSHLKLANGYNKITATIEKILMFEKLTNINEINSKTIDNIINQMEYLVEDSQPIPDNIWNKNKPQLKNIINIILNNENIFNELTNNSSSSQVTIMSPPILHPFSLNIPNNKEIPKESPKENNRENNIEIVYDNTK
jgi:hypothetical protein